MASSNTYLFDPDLADVVDECFERIDMDPAELTARHVRSARRSMNLMLQHWATRGVHTWAVVKGSTTTSKGMTSFKLPAGAIDILTATLRREDIDIEMYPISRSDYQVIPDKDTQGRPDRYYVNRQVGAPEVYFWQAAANDTDVIEYWYFRQMQDVGRARNTLDLPPYFYEAFCAGLASGLAEKYAHERLQEKKALAERALRDALEEDGSRAPLDVRPSFGRGR